MLSPARPKAFCFLSESGGHSQGGLRQGGLLVPPEAEPGRKQGRVFSTKTAARRPGLRAGLEAGQRGPRVQAGASRGWRAGFRAKEGWGLGAPASGLPGAPRRPLSASAPLSTALKSSPSKKGRGASLAVKPLGPTAAFSASQIPSEREDAQYDLRGARSYPTLEDEGDRAGWGAAASVTGEIRGLLGKDDVPGGPRGGDAGSTPV